MPATLVQARHVARQPRIEPIARDRPTRRRERLAVLALVLLTIAVRLPGIARPLVGNFATKNVVYAMIARNFARGDAPWRLPTVDVLAGGQPGWHLLEAPLSAYATAGLWRLGGGSLEIWGRLTAIAWSAAAVAWLYTAVRRTESSRAAAMAAFVLSVAPVSVIYGQSFMLEPSIALLSIAAVDSFARASAGHRRSWWLVGMVALSAAALTKIYLALLVLPILAAVRAERPRALPAAAGLCVLALLPALAWCGSVWRLSAPEAPTAQRIYYSLRDSEQAHRWPSPVLAEPPFYAGIARDLSTVVLTPVGAALALFGVLSLGPVTRNRALSPWLVWLLACAALVALLPGKFQAMNYYWLVTLPPLAALAGIGWDRILERHAVPPAGQAVIFASIAVAGIALALKPAFVTPAEDRAVIAAAEAARALVPAGEPVITSHGACPDLLYYCDRRGWTVPLDAPDLADRIRAAQRGGARYLVWCGATDVSPPELAPLTSLGTLQAHGPGYAIVRLTSTQNSTPPSGGP